MTCRSHSPNFYEVLGICTDATPVQVRAAYHRAALRTHPDKGGCAEDFRLANRAFEVLSCSVTRKLYDVNSLHLPRQGACSAKTTRSAATAGSVATNPACSKRKRTSLFSRQHAQQKKKKKKKKLLNTTVAAMNRLKVILQAMSVKSRREVCTGMSQVMRKALVRFMTDSFCNVSPHGQNSLAFRACPPRHKPQSNATSIRTCTRARGTLYQAQLHMKALRLYARPQESLDLAIQQQIQLSHLRFAMAAEEKADPNIWLDANKVYQMCRTVFEGMATSETELGLRAFVHIRAQCWLGQGVQITSASTTLCTALDAHARLLVARATSWEAFRAEWIQLMLDKGRLTLTEAEVVADGARQTALHQQVAKALRDAEQALEKEQHRARKRTTCCSRTQIVDAAEVVKEETSRPKRSRMSNIAFMGG